METSGIRVWMCTKHLDWKKLSRHSKISSWILYKLISCVSMQALATSIGCDQSFHLDTVVCSHSWCVYNVRNTWRVMTLFSNFVYLILRYIILNATKRNHCNHLKRHVLKKVQSTHVFWGRYSVVCRRVWLLLIEDECASKEPRHVENFTDNRAE